MGKRRKKNPSVAIESKATARKRSESKGSNLQVNDTIGKRISNLGTVTFVRRMTNVNDGTKGTAEKGGNQSSNSIDNLKKKRNRQNAHEVKLQTIFQAQRLFDFYVPLIRAKGEGTETKYGNTLETRQASSRRNRKKISPYLQQGKDHQLPLH